MCSGMGDRTCLLPGSPIRTSPDQSLVDSSPGLFAASHVLHRLLVPRHPPCALTNLATKMLASTVQFSRCGRSRARTRRLPHTTRRQSRSGSTRTRSIRAKTPPGQSRSGSSSPRSVSSTHGSLREHTARSLRTQQRAWADPMCGFRSHIPKLKLQTAVLGEPRHRAGLLVSVPLHEPISEHSSEHGSGPTE